MTNRRDVIKGGMAASAMLGTRPVLAAGRSARPQDPPANQFHAVLYDRRHADSIAFGEEARRRGHETVAIQGDVTAFWYRHLDPVWRKQPVAIAGLTEPGPLFVLERLAWEKGLRVAVRAGHKLDGSQVIHEIEGLAEAPPELPSRGWAPMMAALIGDCRLDSAQTSCRLVGSGKATVRMPEDGLVTWVIAPIAGTGFPRT